MGLTKPRCGVLGSECSGDIEAVGAHVKGFAVGDPVIAVTGVRFGTHAEFVCVSQRSVIVGKPDSLSYEQSAGIAFGGFTALHFLRDKGRVQPGQRVLINGAAGSVGTAAVQLAKHMGAHVTGVCSTRNLELVTSLGADEVIDYTRQAVAPATSPPYDVILDTISAKPFEGWKHALTPKGRYVLLAAGLPTFGTALWTKIAGGRRATVGVTPENVENLRELLRLADAGALRVVIDKVFPFEHIVDAHRYVDQGHKRGNVVLSMATGD